MRISLSVLVNRYLNHLRRDGKSTNTLSAYATDLKQLLAILHDESIHSLTPDKLSLDLAPRLNSLAPSSQVRKLTTIREFLLWAFHAGYLTQKIIPSIKISKTVIQRSAQPLSPSQLVRLRRMATVSERFLLELLLQTGMRLSDACTLKFKHLTSQFVMHPRQRTSISITAPLDNALTRYRQVHTIPPKGFVLMNQFKRPLSVRSATSVLANLSRRAGVRHATARNLRATFIARQVNMGVPIEVIGDIAGHETLAPLEKLYRSRRSVPSNSKVTLAPV